MKFLFGLTVLGILMAGCAAPSMPEAAVDEPTATYRVQAIENGSDFPEGLSPPGGKNKKPPQHTPGQFPGRK